MVEITPVQKSVTSLTNPATLAYWEDKTSNFDTVGIVVDNANYNLGTFLDRDYDVRFFKNLAVLLQNVGANSVDYKIMGATKDFDVLDTDLAPSDFTEELVEETAIAAAVKASATVTIASPVANTFSTGTITCASVQAADTVTVNGLVYTAVSGAKADNTEFDISGTDTEAAADLADSITNDARSGTLGDVTATNTDAVVTATTDVLGVAGNAVTLVSSNGTRLAVSGSGTFTGGVDADTVTVNGLVYTAVAGAKADNTEFSIDSTDTATATDLADSITNDTRAGTVIAEDQTATNTDAVVTVSAADYGPIGNGITLASSDGGRLAVSGANLSGGVDGSSAPFTLSRTTPSITAVKITAKESSGGSPGKLRGDVKFLNV